MQTFKKNERLCGKKTIDNLFINGSSFQDSVFRLAWNTEKFENKIVAKTLIVVPKKNIQNATKRNILKRRIKEAFRIYKSEIYAKIESKKKQLAIAIIYQGKEILPYKTIENKIKLILDRLSEKI
jgi:ribonuclease P protein component